MSKTRHIQTRMSQRGIRQAMLDLTMEFGVEQGDKVVLNKKGLRQLLRELQNTQKVALKMLEKGGLVVVESGGVGITTYRLDSYKRLLGRSL